MGDAGNSDARGHFVVVGSSRCNMGGLVLITTCLYVQIIGRLDADIDVFGEAVNDTQAFGSRCTAFDLELKTLCLQPPKAMLDPVILHNPPGIPASPLPHQGPQPS